MRENLDKMIGRSITVHFKRRIRKIGRKTECALNAYDDLGLVLTYYPKKNGSKIINIPWDLILYIN